VIHHGKDKTAGDKQNESVGWLRGPRWILGLESHGEVHCRMSFFFAKESGLDRKHGA
jgi:hypothetical protein